MVCFVGVWKLHYCVDWTKDCRDVVHKVHIEFLEYDLWISGTGAMTCTGFFGAGQHYDMFMDMVAGKQWNISQSWITNSHTCINLSLSQKNAFHWMKVATNQTCIYF